jgi:hypothetical protein
MTAARELASFATKFQHVGAAPEALPYLPRPPQGPVLLVLALALVAKVVAVAAQEILPRPVQDRHPPAVRYPGADEPGTLSPEVARRPLQEHGQPPEVWEHSE